MILTAHQPVYLPWLGLFHKISLADIFVYFDQVQYLPKDWMNRNEIKTATGPSWLTVPVLKKGHRERKTSEIEINNEIDWRKKHLKTIKNNYCKSPFFEKYIPFFEEIYSKTWLKLTDLNEYMLKWFLNELDIKTKFLKASDYEFKGSKSGLVLDMCKKLKTDLYIFGKMGRDYANINEFENEGVKIIFQDYKHPTYKQLFGKFIPNLSIIDLLFNCGENSAEILISGNISKDIIQDTIRTE